MTAATHTNGHRPVLPDSITDTFRQYRGSTDADYFGLGDAIDAAVVELAGKVTAKAIYKQAAIETEYSIAEVRMLHETARAADSKLRAEFDDALTHAHFRAVRYIDERAVQRGYLRWCLESADQFGGRPAPARKLAEKIQAERGPQKPPPSLSDWLDRARANLDKVYEADPAVLWQWLGDYVAPQAEATLGEAKTQLRIAASELKEAARLHRSPAVPAGQTAGRSGE